MRTRPVRTLLLPAIAVAMCSIGLACVEVRLVKAAVVHGPDSQGTLTLRLDLEVDFEDPAEGDDPPEPLTGQAGYVALALPAGVELSGGSLVAEAELVGDDGRRAMGASPQIAQLYEREFPLDDGRRWVARHVVMDRLELTRDHTLAVELRLQGLKPGVTPLLVTPAYLDESGQVEPARPTEIELTVSKDKALVRIVPAAAAGAGVKS